MSVQLAHYGFNDQLLTELSVQALGHLQSPFHAPEDLAGLRGIRRSLPGGYIEDTWLWMMGFSPEGVTPSLPEPWASSLDCIQSPLSIQNLLFLWEVVVWKSKHTVIDVRELICLIRVWTNEVGHWGWENTKTVVQRQPSHPFLCFALPTP